MRHGNIRHLGHHRHEIIGHVGVQHLAALVIETMLHQRRAQPLHNTAPYLFVDELRVQHRAAILNNPMLQKLDEARLGIDLQQGGLDPICEGKRIFPRHIMAGGDKFGLEVARERVRAEIGNPRHLIEANPFTRGATVDHHSANDVE